MFTKYIPKNIQEKMKAKERALARRIKPSETSEVFNNTYLEPKDMMSRTIFIRMCSNKVNKLHNEMIDGGLYADGTGFFNIKKPLGFSETYKDTSVISGGSLDKMGLKPTPGIKSIEVQYKGGFKAIRECTVNWVVPGIDYLDILHDHFFTVGRTVVVDWGWIYPNNTVDEQLADTFITRDSLDGFEDEGDAFEINVKQDIFTNPQERILKFNGDYDAIGGQITNFEYSLREDGGFDCITKVISMCASLFKKPIDRGGNQAGVKVSGNDAKSTPPDSMINSILNLRNIILDGSFGLDITQVRATYSKQFYNLAPEDASYKDINDELCRITKQVDKAKKYGFDKDRQTIYAENNFSFNVDDPDNPQVLWTVLGSKQDFFVTWGWMEDNIISRYTSFIGGEDKDIKMTMRSIDTVLDAEGKPIPAVPLALRLGLGQDRAAARAQRVVKEPVLIRNPKGLFPVNPFKFFISGIPAYTHEGLGGKIEGKFYKAFLDIGNDSRFPKFNSTKDGLDGRYGILRNVWVNIKEIQDAFGIRKPESKDTSTNNINPPGTLDTAINTLLLALNSNFQNIWEFELVADPYDSTNIKVIDKSDAQLKEPHYTKFGEGDTTDTHVVDDLGIFQFPSYKIGSFVKNQTLQYKIPDSQALTILYGANKKKDETSQDFANGQLEKLFEVVRKKEPDAFLKDLETANLNSEGSEGRIVTNVGSFKTNPNSKIGVGESFGTKIDANSIWWRQWTPDIPPDEEEENITTSAGEKIWGFFFPNSKKGYYDVVDDKGQPTVKFIESDIAKSTKIYAKDENGDLTLASGAQRVLNSYLNSSSPIAQFDMSNLIPAELGLEIDGIGGITPFDIIHTEYIQSIYRTEVIADTYRMSEEEVLKQNVDEDSIGGRFGVYNPPNYVEDPAVRETEQQLSAEGENVGPLTFFQVTDVKHTLDNTGWKTELVSKMRINRIPRSDKLRLSDFQQDKVQVRTINTSGSYNEFPENEVGSVERAQQGIYIAELEYQTNYFPSPVSSTIPQKVVEKEKETAPPTSDENVYVLPGSINSGGNPPGVLVNENPDTNRTLANQLRKAGYKVLNADGTPYDFTPKENTPPVEPSADVVPSEKFPPPETEKERVETRVHKSPGQPNQLSKFPRGEVPKAQVMKTDPVEELNFESPVERVVEVREEAKKEEPKTIIVDTGAKPRDEIIILKSTYDPYWKDWATNPTFKLIYKIVPGWYTKSNNNPKNTSFYGEPPKAAVKTIYRQKFWDEVIEAPNETGKTALDTKEAIDAKLAEIGDTYKNLGPYDTWNVTTGIDYASYNPKTGRADYTDKGIKIDLPTGP